MTTLPRHEGGVKNPTPSSDAQVHTGGPSDTDVASLAADGSVLRAEYYRLLLAVDVAKTVKHQAMMSGSKQEKDDAEQAYHKALSDLRTLKEREAADTLLRLRFVRECHPGRIEEIIDPTHRQELDNIEAAVVEIAGRLDETEAAVVTLADRG